MRRWGIVLVFVILFLASCHRNSDPFVGCWVVERVNVEFDESKSTPEMVRQYGEMEKGNVIEIGKDSILTFVSNGDTMRGHCSLRGTRIFFDGKLFGSLESGFIQTETSAPLGQVKVFYKKEME